MYHLTIEKLPFEISCGHNNEEYYTRHVVLRSCCRRQPFVCIFSIYLLYGTQQSCNRYYLFQERDALGLLKKNQPYASRACNIMNHNCVLNEVQSSGVYMVWSLNCKNNFRSLEKPRNRRRATYIHITIATQLTTRGYLLDSRTQQPRPKATQCDDDVSAERECIIYVMVSSSSLLQYTL